MDASDFYHRFRPQNVDGLTKYAQLREAIRAAIENGYWKRGARLPTEQELAGEISLSLGTVQRALRALGEEGLIVRRPGAGSFVADSDMRLEHPWHCRFLNDDGVGYLPVYVKIASRRVIREVGPWSDRLGTARKGFIEVKRFFNVGGEFTALNLFYADAERMAFLRSGPINRLDGVNLKRLIMENTHARITKFIHHVRSERFSADIRQALEMPKGSPGLFVEAIAHAGRNRPLYYQQYFVPPTRRMLVFSGDGSES